MKTPNQSLSITPLKLASLAGLLISLCSPLFAGSAGTNIYWTRGYDGTVSGTTETTTNDVFNEFGGFTDRVIAGTNTVDDLTGKGYVDSSTGFRTSTSTTATVNSTGSLYLHIGYVNSGYTGTGTTVDTINLNSDLVIGRLAYENTYNGGSSASWTPNIPTVITAGNTNSALIWDFQGTNNILFFRSNVNNAANPQSLQIDANVYIENTTGNSGGLFSMKDYTTLTFGSETEQRIFRIDDNTFSTDDTKIHRAFFTSSSKSVVKVYSDFYWNGSVYNVATGSGAFTFGNVTINHTLSTTTSSKFAALNAAGSINITGDVNINNLGTSGFTFLDLLGDGNTAVVGSAGKALNLNKFGTGAFTLVYMGSSNQNVVINSNIDMVSSAGSHNNVALFKGATSTGSTLTFNGDITLSSNGGSGILGNPWDGAIINFNGTVKSTRKNETSFSGSANAVVNFNGSKASNTFNNIGLRSATFNMLNSNGTSSIEIKADSVGDETRFGMGSNPHINLFSENQIKSLDSTLWRTWAPASGIGATINMNGKNFAMGTYQPGGSNRIMIVDFGMTESGMTSAQMAASGVTADMIFETGAGIAQTFTIAGINTGYSAATVENCYILIKNYVVGEDTIISKVKLSTISFSDGVCHDESDITKNILRVDGYADADKYGIEYYLEETALIDGTWQYSIVLVPETSTIAAIFGVVVLAFAIYRRKNA